nr:AGE family epimerase/isomerase [Acetobacter sacchari]
MVSNSLPLWSSAGFDSARGLYYERLNWDATPVDLEAHRLMVQARQIATYCRASLDGFYDASNQALTCLDHVERLYYRSDGESGWVFSITSGGSPANHTRDLYGHAFILFAYAWAIRVCDSPRYHSIARATVDEIKILFATKNGGYQDTIPPQDDLRRQNPHMHLLEAYLALFEASRDDFYLDEASKLVDLALHKLIEPRNGFLLEFFSADWLPAKISGENLVEPGHLFEWSWLLSEYRNLAILTESQSLQIEQVAERLFHVGLAHGYDATVNQVWDAMTDEGIVSERSTRVWPQTELLRLLCQRDRVGKVASFPVDVIGSQFLARYAPAHLGGGWIDRFDQESRPLVDYMPASSLYHIYGAARELIMTGDY